MHVKSESKHKTPNTARARRSNLMRRGPPPTRTPFALHGLLPSGGLHGTGNPLAAARRLRPPARRRKHIRGGGSRPRQRRRGRGAVETPGGRRCRMRGDPGERRLEPRLSPYPDFTAIADANERARVANRLGARSCNPGRDARRNIIFSRPRARLTAEHRTPFPDDARDPSRDPALRRCRSALKLAPQTVLNNSP